MKVTIIPEKCIACGLCQTYSDHFDYYDNGIVKFTDYENLNQEFTEEISIISAVKNCPTKALIIE